MRRWLASKGQPQAAEQALRSLREPDQIEPDLAEMRAAAEAQTNSQSWALLRSPVVRGELHVGQALAGNTSMSPCTLRGVMRYFYWV